jgi:hypothetical protein
LVSKYSSDFPVHTGKVPPSREVVLITGTTGAFGSHVLHQLLRSDSITGVYALNRASSTGLRERQEGIFRELGLDVSVLNTPKLVLLEGNLSTDKLGLNETVYSKLLDEVTCIIHIGRSLLSSPSSIFLTSYVAWQVNFNLSLSSLDFLILGTRRLIDLALASTLSTPPKFVFTSSVGTLRSKYDASLVFKLITLSQQTGQPRNAYLKNRLRTPLLLSVKATASLNGALRRSYHGRPPPHHFPLLSFALVSYLEMLLDIGRRKNGFPPQYGQVKSWARFLISRG